MKVGALEIVDCWMEGDSEVYKFVTKLEVDKYVPKSLQKHFSKDGLHYTDIITYDPKLIACAPYRLPVKSIAPIFPEKVSVPDCACLECVPYVGTSPSVFTVSRQASRIRRRSQSSDCLVAPW